MLVLSRRIGEQICIGKGIVVTVVSTKGNRIVLGIEAPRDVSVDRQEIRKRKAAEDATR
jgi:carbon storage regulator